MLNVIANKPHRFMFLLIPVILILTLLKIGSTIDIQMYDTYYVISPMHYGLFISSILACFGGLYWLVRKRGLIDWMTIAHIIITSLGLLLITGHLLNPDLFNRTFGASLNDNGQYQTIAAIISTAILIWLLSQIMFLINLVVGVIRSAIK